MTTAYWQAGDYAAAARAVRDWIREEPDRPAPHRTAARIYEDMGALTQALDEREKGAAAPSDARRGSGSAGCGCARSIARARARRSSGPARSAPPSRGCSTSRSWRTSPATSAPRSPPASRRPRVAPESAAAWARYAHALARTDRLTDCLAACERALELADDPEVRDLREQVASRPPRGERDAA